VKYKGQGSGLIVAPRAAQEAGRWNMGAGWGNLTGFFMRWDRGGTRSEPGRKETPLPGA